MMTLKTKPTILRSVRASVAALILTTAALADENVGGFTKEVCVVSGGAACTIGGVAAGACSWAALTASSAYTANNEVGGLVTLSPAFLEAGSGILQSIRLTFLDAQTAEFDVYQFSANPSATTWTDKTGPSIAAADVPKVKPPIKLTNNASGLGTHTVYGIDQLGRALSSGLSAGFPVTSDYFVIVTTGTPTFGSTADATFCASYLQDR